VRKNDCQLQACFLKYPELLEKVRIDAIRLEDACKPPIKDVIVDFIVGLLVMLKRKLCSLCNRYITSLNKEKSSGQTL
jgi:hypothetical protein